LGLCSNPEAQERLAIFASRRRLWNEEVTMPTRNVNLTVELDAFVSRKVESGRYENASEVIRAGLRALELDELEQETRMAALRDALAAGEASGVAPEGVFDRVKSRIRAQDRAEIG
jgi:antitoxin ParD1/3/4